MASPLSVILKALRTTITAWAASVEPVPGVVSVAADEVEANGLMQTAPKGWRVCLFIPAEDGVQTNENKTGLIALVTTARGLSLDARAELEDGRGSLPPVLDIVEGVGAALRGLYVEHPACPLLTFTGWQWVKYELENSHYVARLAFAFSRQPVAPVPLALTLS